MSAANTSPEAIKSTLRGFFAEKIVPIARVKSFGDDESFIEKGILDSTGVLELLQYVEEAFGIRVADQEIVPDNLDSLNKLTTFVGKKTAEKK